MSDADSTLTHERLTELLRYDPISGVFVWLKPPGRRVRAGDRAGTISEKGYRKIRIDGRGYKASRLAWLYVTRQWPVHGIDHHNCCRDDDRFENLRDVTFTTNQQNKRKPQRRNKTGFLGVRRSQHSGFIAEIQVDDRSIYLGSYRIAEEAHAAYVAAKRILHPGCTI
ncbi:MAG: HNH endonuclease [Betaproteobacteria bacterium]|nr:HNH endonuclease [Betaproteobacteria bacterium]